MRRRKSRMMVRRRRTAICSEEKDEQNKDKGEDNKHLWQQLKATYAW